MNLEPINSSMINSHYENTGFSPMSYKTFSRVSSLIHAELGIKMPEAKKVMLQNADLYAARVDGWAPVDQEGIAIAAGETEEQMPALASDSNGRLLCVYEKHKPDGRVLVTGRTLRTK